jgi:hypothetical protein
MTPEEIIAELRKLPDFECYPLPLEWHKKFNIPLPSLVTPTEFYESNYTLKCSLAPKDLQPIIIDRPIKDGFYHPIFPPEEYPTTVTQVPYTETNPPKILKGLVEAEPETPVATLTEEERLAILKEREEIRKRRHDAWRETLTEEERERDTVLGNIIMKNLNSTLSLNTEKSPEPK